MAQSWHDMVKISSVWCIQWFLFSDLIRDIEECMNSPRPVAFRLVQMFDVGAWMKFYRESLHEHVHPHCFKFEKVDSKVVMYYRKWSNDNWMGPVNVLKVSSKENKFQFICCDRTEQSLPPPPFPRAPVTSSSLQFKKTWTKDLVWGFNLLLQLVYLEA